MPEFFAWKLTMTHQNKTVYVLILPASILIIAAFAILKWQSMRQDHFVQVEVSNLGGTYTLQSAGLPGGASIFPSAFYKMIGNPIAEIDLSINSWPRLESITPIPPVHDKDLRVISSLKQLSRLSLRGMPITDTSVNQLVQFKNLKQLDIRDTQISEQGWSRLQVALPACEVVIDPAG